MLRFQNFLAQVFKSAGPIIERANLVQLKQLRISRIKIPKIKIRAP